MSLIVPFLWIIQAFAGDDWSHVHLHNSEFVINIDFQVKFIRGENSRQITDELYINLYYRSINETDSVEATLVNFNTQNGTTAIYLCDQFKFYLQPAPHFAIHIQDCRYKLSEADEEWHWPILPLVVRQSFKQSVQASTSHQTLQLQVKKTGENGQVINVIDPWSQTKTFKMSLYDAFVANGLEYPQELRP